MVKSRPIFTLTALGEANSTNALGLRVSATDGHDRRRDPSTSFPGPVAETVEDKLEGVSTAVLERPVD